MRIAAYCDFYGDALRPLQLIIQASPGELDWTTTLHIEAQGPFEPFEAEEFGDLPGASVLLEDLTGRPGAGNESTIGILLPQIAARHSGSDIQLLILQMDDVEEVLRYKR